MPDELATMPDRAPALAVPRGELHAIYFMLRRTVETAEETETMLAAIGDPFATVLLRGMREGTAKHRQTRDVIAAMLGRKGA